ncbi:MAG: hypothetical protein N2319_13330 [Candidatus Kapabacteria bacterium]|nr:hypothetical protein [Candidatus Kapabacteria bacterium]
MTGFYTASHIGISFFPVIPVHTGISSSHRDSCIRRSDILGLPPQEQGTRHSHHPFLSRNLKKN